MKSLSAISFNWVLSIRNGELKFFPSFCCVEISSFYWLQMLTMEGDWEDFWVPFLESKNGILSGVQSTKASLEGFAWFLPTKTSLQRSAWSLPKRDEIELA